MIRRALFLAAALALATPVVAADAWTGTWVGGYENGAGVQLIMVGDDAIGLAWHDDYVEDLASSVSTDERTLSLTWKGGTAEVVAGSADGKADMTIHEPGKPDTRIDLDRETE